MKNVFLFQITLCFLFFQKNSYAQDTIRLDVCPIMWSTAAPVKIESVVLNIHNPSLPVEELVFYPVTGEDCIAVVITPSNQSIDASYSITATKTQDGLNGITINDDLMIGDHILGINPFPQFPQMFAADVNKSGAITTLDMVWIRKRLLGFEDPIDLTWGFIPEYWTFPNVNNPFDPNNGPCCEKLSLTEIANYNGNSVDLISFKKGDVDGDADPQNFAFMPVFAQSMQVGMLNEPIGFVGEEGLVSFTPLVTNQGIGAFQITLNFDPTAVEITGIESQFNASFNIIGYKIIIYGNNWPELIVPNNDIVQLKVKWLATGNFADYITFPTQEAASMIAIGSANDPILANIEYSIIQPIIKTKEISENIGLQAFPNPMNEDGINLSFLSNKKATTQLIVTDLKGEIIYQKNIFIQTGENQINIPATAIGNGASFYHFDLNGTLIGGKIVK
jgi:hypothetical protein